MLLCPRDFPGMNTVAAAKSLQSCPTLCDPIDGSPPGSPVPGILPARTLEWVAISFSNAWKWKEKGKSLSRVWLFATPWTAAHQAPPSIGFSRQECWSGVECYKNFISPSRFFPSIFICSPWCITVKLFSGFNFNTIKVESLSFSFLVDFPAPRMVPVTQ